MSDELSHLCNSYNVQLLNMTVYKKYHAGALIMMPVTMAETATHPCEQFLQKNSVGVFPLDEQKSYVLQMTGLCIIMHLS